MSHKKAIAIDCETGKREPLIEFDLYSGFKETPMISFMLPIECLPNNHKGGNVFEFSLQDLLESALDYHLDFDGGEGTHKITSMLRYYADRLDKSVSVEMNKKNIDAS